MDFDLGLTVAAPDFAGAGFSLPLLVEAAALPLFSLVFDIIY